MKITTAATGGQRDSPIAVSRPAAGAVRVATTLRLLATTQRRLEWASTVLPALATVATGWAAYQSRRRRFRPEFQPAFAAWLAAKPFADAGPPLTPFVLPRYRLRARAAADGLEAKAAAASERAEDAN